MIKLPLITQDRAGIAYKVMLDAQATSVLGSVKPEELSPEVARALRQYETARVATEATTAISKSLMMMYAAPIIGVGIAGLLILIVLAVML